MTADYYAFDDALRELGIGAEELIRMVREGELRVFRDGNRMRFRREDVDALKQKRDGPAPLPQAPTCAPSGPDRAAPAEPVDADPPADGAARSLQMMSVWQILVELELVSKRQVQEALQIQREKGGDVGHILVDLGYISDDDLQLATAAQQGVDLGGADQAERPSAGPPDAPAPADVAAADARRWAGTDLWAKWIIEFIPHYRALEEDRLREAGLDRAEFEDLLTTESFRRFVDDLHGIQGIQLKALAKPQLAALLQRARLLDAGDPWELLELLFIRRFCELLERLDGIVAGYFNPDGDRYRRHGMLADALQAIYGGDLDRLTSNEGGFIERRREDKSQAAAYPRERRNVSWVFFQDLSTVWKSLERTLAALRIAERS